MKIALCYSMQFSEQAKKIKQMLEQIGHTAHVSVDTNEYIGKNEEEQEKIKLGYKYQTNILWDYFDVIANSNAILVLNFDKHEIANYIGGNTFLEMGIAYYLKKSIYLLNPIPHMPFYETEIIAMKPVILNGNISKIPL